MADTIRETILKKIQAALETILTTNGYLYDLGETVERGRMMWEQEERPAISILAGVETREDGGIYIMPVNIEAHRSWTLGENSSVVAEAMLGILKTCILGVYITIGFSNGSVEVYVGDELTDDGSGATGNVSSVTVSSGSWIGGDAAGTIELWGTYGEFDTSSSLEKAGAPCCDISTITYNDIYDGYVDSIAYRSGGPIVYPDVSGDVIITSLLIDVKYFCDANNPYKK